MVMVRVEIPEQVEAEARRLGLLSGEKLAALIEAEVERERQQQRREAWQRLDEAMEPVREAFRAEYGHLSEEEVIDMIDTWLHEVRAEMQAERENATL